MSEKELHTTGDSLEAIHDLGGIAAEIIAEDKFAYNEKLAEEVRKIRRERAKTLHSDLIFSLVHLKFDEPTAKKKWKEILEHKYFMSQKLGRNVGIRVAIMDYFINITNELNRVTMMDLLEYEETARESITDWLTGIYQKGYFISLVESEIKKIREQNGTAGILFFDLDRFKIFNDINGHLVGDVLLRLFVDYVSDLLKNNEHMGRYGGEEFVIFFPDLDETSTLKRAEEIRRTVADLPFPGQEVLPQKRITVSGGVAIFPKDGKNVSELLKSADEALYRAKKDGRNKIYSARN